jgi:hypothetical protein
MSIQQDDPLYVIFEEHLHSGLYDTQPIEKFITDVVDFYWETLQRSGHVPHRMHELMRLDFVQEVHDMLRAKTYGHFGIGEYNKGREKKIS